MCFINSPYTKIAVKIEQRITVFFLRRESRMRRGRSLLRLYEQYVESVILIIKKFCNNTPTKQNWIYQFLPFENLLVMVPLAIEKIGMQVSIYIPLKTSIYINIYTQMHKLFAESVAQFGREELYYYHKNSKSNDCTIQVYSIHVLLLLLVCVSWSDLANRAPPSELSVIYTILWRNLWALPFLYHVLCRHWSADSSKLVHYSVLRLRVYFWYF